jgi:hypothetical protein
MSPALRASAARVVRGEEVFAAAGDDERRQLLQPAAYRACGDREAARSVTRSDERVLLGGGADEDAVVQPLRLYELELALQVGAGEDEDDPAVFAVVLEHPLGQHRRVARAAADHAVQSDVDASFSVERVARIRTPRMSARRALEAAQVVAVEKVVVALRVGTDLGVVVLGSEHQRRPALPAADHLRPQQRLLVAARRLGAQVLTIGGDPRVQFPEDDVRPVAAEHLGHRHRRQLSRLVGVAEDDLSGLDRPLLRVRGRDAAPLDRRLSDPILETEGGAPSRELIADLTPHDLDAWQLLVCAPRPLRQRLQARRVG